MSTPLVRYDGTVSQTFDLVKKVFEAKMQDAMTQRDIFYQMSPCTPRVNGPHKEISPFYDLLAELKALFGKCDVDAVNEGLRKAVENIDSREAYVEGYIRDNYDD